MKFAIGNTEYFKSVGFDPSHWRKSLDGKQALVHYELVRYVADKNKITVYQHDAPDFVALMEGDEWSEQEDEQPTE